MRPPSVFGWTAIDAGPADDPKWLSVKDVRFPERAPMSPDLVTQAHLIDAGVNQRIVYTAEPLGDWRAPDPKARKGNCIDSVLIKRANLIAVGVDPASMAVLVVRDLLTQGRPEHALLLVDTGDDFLVLDSLNSLTLSASATEGWEPVVAYGDTEEWTYGREALKAA